MTVDNPNPVVHAVQTDRKSKPRPVVDDEDEEAREPFCAGELFDLIRDIIDPEHPYTLEQLKVVTEGQIWVEDAEGLARVEFTPTVQVDIFVHPGSHSSEEAVNKQLNDKERVAAALENPNLVAMVDKCLDKGGQGPGLPG